MKEKKQRDLINMVIFIFVFVAIIIIVLFNLRFGFSFSAGLETWEKTASYFNNILSPFLVTATIMLLFVTWKDNKNELKQIRKQNEIFQKQNESHQKQTESHQKSQDNQSLYLAISPQITRAIEDVRKGKYCALVCDVFKPPKAEHECIVIQRADIQRASQDLKEFLEFRAINIVTKEKSDIYLSRKLEVPKHPNVNEERKILDCVHKLALKVKQKEKGRKYKQLPKNQADLNKHFKASLLFQLNNKKYIENLVSNYMDNSSVSFLEYCELRFGNWEQELSDCISEQSSPFRPVMENIEYIASLMNMLPDDCREKIILSKYIYKSLGRYAIYVFLEHTFQLAYDSNSPFKNHFENSFTEISKVLFLNEKRELYMHRLSTKWNSGFTEKLQELSTES